MTGIRGQVSGIRGQEVRYQIRAGFKPALFFCRKERMAHRKALAEKWRWGLNLKTIEPPIIADCRLSIHISLFSRLKRFLLFTILYNAELCQITVNLKLGDHIMRADMLNSLLTQLNSSSPDIEASAIISTDGLTIASMLPAGMDEDRVGAMSAAMLSLGDRTSQELVRGTLEQLLVKGNKGYVLMTHAGENAVLTVLTRSTAKLGLVFLDVKRTADEVAKMVG